MKTKLFSLILVISVTSISSAQNYQINFTGNGAGTVVDSVKVENLTQCTSINISGSDILNLVESAGTSELNSGINNKIIIYPNPAAEYCMVNFESRSKGYTSIGLFDTEGKKIGQVQELLTEGNHTYQINGISKGIYMLKVESEDYCYNSWIVSLNEINENLEIRKVETNSYTLRQRTIIKEKTIKTNDDEKLTVVMQYNSGDVLKMIGKSGFYRTVIILIPTSTQTVNFTFVDCTDDNGNHYSVVQIGSQWWMAENLNAGTYVPITTPQVSGTKFCMDINGQANPNCPMGGLYEFANLLQGSSPCNGTGGPPNDICAVPIKGLCPAGWHIPSHYEWTTLERNAGSNPAAFPYDISTISLLGTDEGGNLKETCSSNWWTPNAGATNLSGFTGLPGGDTWNGVFEDFGQSGYFWTSSETFFMAWVHALNYSLSVIGRSSYAEESGFSCRCVKD